MNVLKLLEDYSITHQTEGHKHCRPGWVNVPCPFCTGNPGLHLGITLDGSHAYCWRCGWKPLYRAIAVLLNVTEGEARRIARSYGGKGYAVHKEAPVRMKAHRLPDGVEVMSRRHRLYLTKRKFDPEKLEAEWGLLGTGPIAYLDNIDFRHRIIIPIRWNGEQVSFQARDFTGKSDLRYITCPKDRELVFHKHILYAKQEAWTETGIIVEGATDVWRFGPISCATFGIEYTQRQLIVIAKSFKRVFVVYDDDPQAVIQAQKMVSELRSVGGKAWWIPIDGDPGSMSQDNADHLVKSLIRRIE